MPSTVSKLKGKEDFNKRKHALCCSDPTDFLFTARLPTSKSVDFRG
jgi:hypothetical protein